MRTLVVAHVYYPQFWPELACCIRNIDGMRDLIVTYVDEASVVGAKRDFPTARFLKCENRGYDVWPFVRALQLTSGLSAYDVVVKLHTKRDVVSDVTLDFNGIVLNGSAWRWHLLRFVRTSEAWRKTQRLLARPGIGMVAERRMILRWRDVPVLRAKESFDVASRFLGLDPRIMRKSGKYVAGTMFAAKSAALLPLLAQKLTAEMFEPSAGHKAETFAHIAERALGLSVSAAGMEIAAFNGPLWSHRIWHRLVRLIRT